MKPIEQNLPAVSFYNVSIQIGDSTILNSITATVPKGGSTAIVGPNGAGKTSLLMALLGEMPCTGNITIAENENGEPLRIGYVPQRLPFDRGMPITVIEFMSMGRQRMPFCFGVRKKHREYAKELLKSVKAEELANRHLGALSGGEMQRVLLALALGENPDLLILDEPAAGVDFLGERLFCELLEKLRKEKGFTQLMVSHDLGTVSHHATHVICLNSKLIAEGTPKQTLTYDTLSAVFGHHMGLVCDHILPHSKLEHDHPCCNEEGKES